MALEWEANGDIFKLDVTTFSSTRLTEEIERLSAELLAGEGPDIFSISASHNPRLLAASGFLTDFYTLIDQDPFVLREDFFTNVLDAFTFDGGLYIFPLRFAFRFAGINMGLPEWLIERFAAHSTISESELLAIYADLRYLYGDEFGQLAMVTGFAMMQPINIASRAIGAHIDLNSRMASLTDDSFVSFLRNMTRALGNAPRGTGYMNTPFLTTPESMRYFSGRYTFFSVDDGFNALSSLFEAYPDYRFFGHHTPITDDRGRLLLNFYSNDIWPSQLMAVSSLGNQALSWEYMQHLIQAMANPDYPHDSYPFSLPIKRALVQETLDNLFAQARGFAPGLLRGLMGPSLHRDDAWHERFSTQVQIATERLLIYSEMPIAPFPIIPESLFEMSIEQMFLGNISAEDAAQQIHSGVSSWLME